jgi:dolichyl-diphosphooligosaccharide--protein glycosyltransferase
MTAPGVPSSKDSGILGSALRYFTLACICVFSFCIRLFSVVKYESVIHEFDPYFK